MNHPLIPQHDAILDLMVDRIIDLPRTQIWTALTQPDLVKQWFAPAPWTTVDCDIALYPGGVFRTVMQSPEGQSFTHTGCFLEVIEQEKLTWTTALSPGFRPSANATEPPPFTAVITLGQHSAGVRYTAIAMHMDEHDCSAHSKMGFHEGWGAALDQLIAVVRR